MKTNIDIYNKNKLYNDNIIVIKNIKIIILCKCNIKNYQSN